MPGELSRKSVANAFWEFELQQELIDRDLFEKWLFNKSAVVANNFCGSKAASTEFVVRQKSVGVI